MSWISQKTKLQAIRLSSKRRLPSQISYDEINKDRIGLFVCTLKNINTGDEYLVDRIINDTIEVRRWDGSSFSGKAGIAVDDLDIFSVEIEHFYKSFRIKYLSTREFLTCRMIRCAFWKHCFESLRQWNFNRRTNLRFGRLEVLERLVADHLAREVDTFDAVFGPEQGQHPIDIFGRLYSNRAFSLPDADAALREFEFVLDSLAESRELEKDGNRYMVSARALNTIEVARNSRRRHDDHVKLNVFLGVYTFILAIVGILNLFL